MKYVIFYASLFLITCMIAALARADWICTDESSYRSGNEYNVCGVAVAESEAEARHVAFLYAKMEFDELCAASSDCVGRVRTIIPKRTTCKQTKLWQGGTGYKCQRLLKYIVD